MKVYYLTATPYALSNLALQRVRISRLLDLNDPFELLAADLADADQRRAFQRMKQELNDTKGLICFSESWSNPLLWGHYADKHTGMALGIEVPESNLEKVIYATKRVKLQIDQNTKKPILNEYVVNKLIRTKFEDWKYEEEWRAFIQLDQSTKESGSFFMDFSNDFQLSEVVLGPRCDIPINRVRALVAGYPNNVKVLKARIAFKSFRVVEAKNLRYTSI